jgi:hypothetical protein
MITFARRSLWDSIKYRFSSTYRAKADAELRQSIRWLVEHPEAPCAVEGYVVPNGYGDGLQKQIFGVRVL